MPRRASLLFSPIPHTTPLLFVNYLKCFNSLSLTIQHLVRAFFTEEKARKKRKSALSKKGGALRQLRSIHRISKS